jgi:hypothetical protein
MEWLQVTSGLQQAILMPWNAAVRVIIHIADAPAHGKIYHDITYSDRYQQGDPSGLDVCELMQEIAKQGIDYYFVRLSPDTDIMTAKMKAAYESARVNEYQQFMIHDVFGQPVDLTVMSSPLTPSPVVPPSGVLTAGPSTPVNRKPRTFNFRHVGVDSSPSASPPSRRAPAGSPVDSNLRNAQRLEGILTTSIIGSAQRRVKG